MLRATTLSKDFHWAQLCPPVALLALPTPHEGSFAEAAALPSGGLHQEHQRELISMAEILRFNMRLLLQEQRQQTTAVRSKNTDWNLREKEEL